MLSEGGRFIEDLVEQLSFFRQVEVDQCATETARLPGAESDSRPHPDDAHNFRRRAESEPEHQANEKTGQGSHEAEKRPLVLTQKVMHERGQIDAHECNEGPEIQHFSAQTVAKQGAYTFADSAHGRPMNRNLYEQRS